jgi:hypothetical protein
MMWFSAAAQEPTVARPHRTLLLTFSPALPVVSDTAEVGTVLATIVVRVSDGTPFTGSLGFGRPDYNDHGICAIEGRTVILGKVLPLGASTQVCTITARE